MTNGRRDVPAEDRRRPCRLCGKEVVYRMHPQLPGTAHNRYTHPHKCEHGNWCRAGSRLHGRYHANECCAPWRRLNEQED